MTARTFWGLAVVMLLVGAYSEWQLFGPAPDEGLTPEVAAIPHEIGAWRVEDVTLDQRTYEILETRNVLYREYRADPAAPPIALCIVYARANRKAPHPPEVCYTGAGAHVDKRPAEVITLASRPLPGNVLQVVHGQTREVVLYWYLAGDRLLTSYYGQQLAIMWNQVTGRPAQSALIRYSTSISPGSPHEAMARLKAFSESSLPIILDQLS